MSMGPDIQEDKDIEIQNLKYELDKYMNLFSYVNGKRGATVDLLIRVSAERKKYWLALEKLKYKGRDGWSGDDCAEYAEEIIGDEDRR